VDPDAFRLVVLWNQSLVRSGLLRWLYKKHFIRGVFTSGTPCQ
jgi:hypothetical protein